MIKNFVKTSPIIIGLAGKAGSGKTSVAERICPKGSIGPSIVDGVTWDHIFYALPLYEMASIRRSIRGHNEVSRKKHALHNVLYDLYGGTPIGNMPEYDTLVARVHEIMNVDLGPEDQKPRSFLQKAGDICRQDYPNCFADWAIMKSVRLYMSHRSSAEEDQEPTPFGVIISDVRFINEAQSIQKMPNGLVIYFSASQETLNDRLIKRDGRISTPEQDSHKSETESFEVEKIADIIIKTDDLSLEQQVETTLNNIGTKEALNA